MSVTQQLKIVGNDFNLGDKPFKLISGAMHFFRILPEQWEDRLLKLKALGCNTVETYVAWNAHEHIKGKFDFSGLLDIERFITTAQKVGLHVIVRPGPYICAEWDFGGLPWWLLKEEDMAIRTADPKYLRHVDDWFNELIPRLVPFQSTHGGPILAVQIENEYGYFANDSQYLQHLSDSLHRHKIDVPLFTSDGPFQALTLKHGGLDGVLRTANFGSDAENRLKVLRQCQPTGPLICMEFWIGWFDAWGQPKHHRRDPADAADALHKLLTAGAQVNFYMFHGGTNFGFNSGANNATPDTAGGPLAYKPFVTSYDYDALLDEVGDITPKYVACRDVLGKHANITPPPLTFSPSKKVNCGKVTFTESVSLFDALPNISKPIQHRKPQPMERLDQGNGYILYRGQLTSTMKGEKLRIRGMRDWCNIFLNGQSIATWYRNDEHPDITIDFSGETAVLEVLVENMGRANFSHLTCEKKGIDEGIFLGTLLQDSRLLCGWDHYTLPMNNLDQLKFSKGIPTTIGPRFYKGQFQVNEIGDTFLSLAGWTKGFAVVNGFNLGRYWKIGPQQTLYVPWPLLKQGANDIIVFESSETTCVDIFLTDVQDIG